MRHAILLLMLMLAAAAPAGAVPVQITRADLAAAYLRFEEAYRQHPPDDADRARVHRAFDDTTLLFLGARHAEAIQAMNALTQSLLPPAQRTAARTLAESLQVRIHPLIARRTRPSVLRIRITPMYATPPAEVALRLTIRPDAPNSQPVLDVPVNLAPGGPPPTMTLPQPAAALGPHLVELVSAEGERFPVGRWSVVEVQMDVIAVGNERRLATLRPTTPAMQQTVTAARTRNGVINDQPSLSDRTGFLNDPITFARQVQSEVESIFGGQNPYKLRVGDWWRGVLAGAMQIPVRVYAPKQVLEDRPLPLVIALHGAGADEAMFLDGYGQGAIKRLADQHGFLVVAPSTYWVMPNPGSLDALVEAMSVDYRVDRSRIYVIGHSLGAAAAVGMAGQQLDRVAAAVAIAGGLFEGRDRLPPTLVIGGALDPIVSAARLRTAADAASAAGLPVEFRLAEDTGHTLIVADRLPEAIEWLLQHRSGASEPAAAP